MLQDRARGGLKEKGAGAGARPSREVGGGVRFQGAVAETAEDVEDENDAIRKRGNAVVGGESQDGLTDIAAAAGKVKWSVIGRQRCHLAA